MGSTILSLFSGLVGSVIGAGATVWATYATINKTSEKAESLEKIKEEKQTAIVFKKLNIELFEIQRILGKYNSKVSLPSSVWENSKPFIIGLSPEQFELLFDIYDKVHEYNAELKIEIEKESKEKTFLTISDFTSKFVLGNSISIGRELEPLVEAALKEFETLIIKKR